MITLSAGSNQPVPQSIEVIAKSSYDKRRDEAALHFGDEVRHGRQRREIISPDFE